MASPFPGMDPYLEHPSLWPDVHNRLIAALADDLSERVAPRYYVGLERRTYLLKADDLVFIGRPDIAVASAAEVSALAPQPVTSVTVLEVEVPMQDEVSENFLEIHEVKTGKLITLLELLSPVNKLHKQGREEYERKPSLRKLPEHIGSNPLGPIAIGSPCGRTRSRAEPRR